MDSEVKLYVGKTHTQPLIEDPMSGGRDVLTDEILSVVRADPPAPRSRSKLSVFWGRAPSFSCLSLQFQTLVHRHSPASRCKIRRSLHRDYAVCNHPVSLSTLAWR